MMIISNIEGLRDPFVLLENGVYYAYGTAARQGDWDNTKWGLYKNTSGSLSGKWEWVDKDIAVVPEDATKNRWAPEVYKYGGAYYMFATYYSSKTLHRGCSVLKASSPEGPFTQISDGHITPHDRDSIDGTLYVDRDGQPWMVFVHEWTCTDDGIGRMDAAKLSSDLTRFASEPIELFRADDPSWTDQKVTDGCFMYETEGGELLMIWSNFEPDGYCVGIARSENGRIDGKWIQEDKLLFSKALSGDFDGGHGMLFKDTEGRLFLTVHSPNFATAEHGERTVFVPIKEENGTLVWDV